MRTENATPTLLSMSELAERWRLSSDTVRRRCQDGTLPAFRVGRSVRIPLTAVEAIEATTTTKAA